MSGFGYPNPYRRCGGTPYSVWEAELPAEGDTTKIVRVEGSRVNGCGACVTQRVITRTDAPANGGRPLFAKTLAVVICPTCDGPGNTAPPATA